MSAVTAVASPPHRVPPHPVSRVLLACALLAATTFWLWLATAVHTMPVIGGEIDGYMLRAENLLDGKLVADRLHPFGLPVAIAGLGLFGIDLFVAGKLIGIASGLLLLVCTYLLARTWVGPCTAALVAFAVGASEHVLVGAVQACSDIPAAALMGLCLLAWTRSASHERPRASGLVLGGLALGIAVFVRAPSMAYAPAFVPLVLGVAWREATRRLAWAGVGGIVGLAPHVATTWLSGQSLGQNGSQIVWKYRFLHDDAGFHQHLASPQPVSWSELWQWLGIGATDLLRYLTTEIAAPWCPPVAWLTTAVSLVLSAALIAPCLLRRRVACVASLAGGAFASALCVLSMPERRLTVPILAPVVVLATLGWLRWPAHLRAGPAVLAALLALGAAANVPRSLAAFEALHARAEMAVARELIAEHGGWVSIALPTVGIERGLPAVFHCFSPLPAPPGAPVSRWDRLLADPGAASAAFVIVSRRSHPTVHEALRREPVPSGYERRRDGDVLVFARTRSDDWLVAASVDVEGAQLVLRLRLADTLTAKDMAAVGFLARRRPDGEWSTWSLPRSDDGGYELAMPIDRLRAGHVWEFVPGVLSWQGEWRRAPPIEWTVPAVIGR